ncbi:MAG: BglII/BstYI family type II restriction endonuclease [Thermomicrobiales bacterium]
MRIVGIYSFNGGREVIEQDYAAEYAEIREVIAAVDARGHRTFQSKEPRRKSKGLLYAPTGMNNAFKQEFATRDWIKHKIESVYPTEFYVGDYVPKPKCTTQPPYREMDFVKNRVGVEVQFGKYSFMVYNVCAKMTIFNKLDIIDVGVEIVGVHDLTADMSSGVSYFEQFVWDLEHRGVSDIDIPVLIIGITE